MIFYLYSKNKLTPDFEAVTKVSAGHRIYLCLVIVSLKTCGLERREKCFPEEQTTISWLKAWIRLLSVTLVSYLAAQSLLSPNSFWMTGLE